MPASAAIASKQRYTTRLPVSPCGVDAKHRLQVLFIGDDEIDLFFPHQ